MMIRLLPFVASFFVGAWCTHIGNYRIFGGTNTSIIDHPWMVSLWWEPNYLCAGFLISPSWVLTNAVCDSEEPSVVYAGSSTREKPTDDNVYANVDKHVIHPNYHKSGDVPNNDIALLHLAKPLTGENIKSIKLPDAGQELPDGTKLKVVGWGMYNDPKTVLEEVQMPIIGEQTCSEFLDNLRYNHSTVLCLGDLNEGGIGPCTGDDGAPAEYNGVAFAIVSYYPFCASQKIPTFFTKISNYRNWIKEVTGI